MQREKDKGRDTERPSIRKDKERDKRASNREYQK
jgi:hypothetical protein